MDAVPVFSQIKSFAQWATGNSKGAQKTQENFLKLCPVVSQVTSIFQALDGDTKGAIETQINFVKVLNGIVDSVPGVGHVKGTLHYVCGDKEGCDNAIKAASHSTGVVGGSLAGFMVGGPVGAAAGGAAGGVLVDGIISFAEVAVDGEKAKMYGSCDTIMRIIEDPTDGGNYVDLIGATALDGMAGYNTGKRIQNKIEYNKQMKKLEKTVGKDNAKMIADAGDKMRETNSNTKIKSNKPQVMTRVKDHTTGKIADGHNKQMRKVLKTTTNITNGQTELHLRVPSAKQVLKRHASTCAEQHAYNSLYTNNPEASPNDLTCVSIKWNPESKGPVTIQRCANCLEYSPAMGDVPTDRIPETRVPKRVGFGETAAETALDFGLAGLSNKVQSDSDDD